MRACTKCGEIKPLDQFPPVRRGEPKLQTWCRDCFAEANAKNYRKNHEREKARIYRYVAERKADSQVRIIEYLATHPCVDCGETDVVVLEFDHLRDKVANVSTYANSGRSWALIQAEIDKCEVRCANCHRRKTLARASRKRDDVITSRRRRDASEGGNAATPQGASGERKCRVCGRTKQLCEFPLRSATRLTYQWICLLCQREYARNWYARNKQRHMANVRASQRGRAGEMIGRVLEYLAAHPCVDCGQTDPILLDFDHLRDKRAEVKRLVRGGFSWEVVAAEIAKCEVRCANCHRRRTSDRIGAYRVVLRPRRDSDSRPSDS